MSALTGSKRPHDPFRISREIHGLVGNQSPLTIKEEMHPTYPTMIDVPQIIKVVLLNSVGLSFHFKNIRRIHLVLNRNSKVVCKLLAVDGGRHEDHLQ